MAKIPFTKLSLKKKDDIKIVKINDLDIEVKQYLDIDEKIALVTRVIEGAHNPDFNYVNPMLVEVLTSLEIIMNYTNINFTEKQKEDIAKLYDTLESNGIINKIIEVIPPEEYKYLIDCVDSTIDSIYTYRQSVLGILDTISKDYSDLSFDVEKLQNELSNPENLSLLRDVLTKLG